MLRASFEAGTQADRALAGRPTPARRAASCIWPGVSGSGRGVRSSGRRSCVGLRHSTNRRIDIDGCERLDLRFAGLRVTAAGDDHIGEVSRLPNGSAFQAPWPSVQSIRLRLAAIQ